MPADEEVLGFKSRWYAEAIRTAWTHEVSRGLTIRVVSAPEFLASKWEAFADRGAGDWYGSHDVEDVVAVVAGRPQLHRELADCLPDLRRYVAERTRELLASGVADDVIAGALPDARTVVGLVSSVRARLDSMADLGTTR
jgi:predicted nucleotidyltransferase